MPRRSTLLLVVLLALVAVPRLVAAGSSRARVVRLTVGPFPVPAHRDREVCRVVRVPGIAGMAVRSWEARSRTSRGGHVGSHHFVAYGYSGNRSDAFPGPNELVDDPGCSSLGPPDFFKARAFLAGSGGSNARASDC